MIFTDVVTKWPGSHHDFFIMNSSTICSQFESGKYGTGWLLGDSGYTLKRWLITPVSRPMTEGENKFNRANKKTRSLIERSFGILKSRWRIVHHTGGTLCYSPSKVAKITIACCVLHNICFRSGTPFGAEYRPDPNGFSVNASAGDTPCLGGDCQRADIISMILGV